METASVADRVAHYDSGPASQRDRGSPTPEEGFVKGKTGRFGTNSLAVRPKNAVDKALSDITPPTMRDMQHLVPRSVTESPSQNRKADIGMQQPLSNHTKEVVGSPIPRPMPDSVTHNSSNVSQNDRQFRPKKPKPPIPRKPVTLANAKPPGPAGSHLLGNQEEPQKPPSPEIELVGASIRSRSPRPYGSNKQSPSSHLLDELNQSLPPPEEFKPKLPPRTGTSSTNQSPSPQASINSLSDEFKPTLPPRRGTSTISRKPTRNQSFGLEDNESQSSSSTSSRLPNNSSPSLLDGPNALDKIGPSRTTSSSPLASDQAQPAKKVPPLPPRQRRQRRPGLQSTVQSAETSRGGVSGPHPPPRNMQRPPQRSATPSSRNQSIKPLHTIPRKLPGSNATEPTPKITPKEQKRYESVWAVNKGLLIPGPNEPYYHMYPPGASEMVLNLVVRDIWSRSCLPNDILLRVWDLVDRQNIRLLTREEFIVGTWLIDQILMGNRLPEKVPASAWDGLSRPSDVSLI